MSWAPTASLVQFETLSGDRIVGELPQLNDPAPRRGRPVIYLDQNHWSTLARAMHAPERVKSDAERQAALDLADLADNRLVILPMSAGHMSETGKWGDGTARYELALTILQLSAGWQMRDPLDLRRLELRSAFALRFKHYCLIPPRVFTLEPGAMHGADRRGDRYEPPADFPPEAAFVVRALTDLSGNFDALLDTEHIAIPPSSGWADRLQGFTNWLASEPRDPHRRRQRTNAFFLSDFGMELPEEASRAGISPEQLSEWMLSHSDSDVKRLPSLGLFREVLREKILNSTTKWTSNDLTDMIYLSCASAYADHVVCERQMASQIVSALHRLDWTANVHRNLVELVSALQLITSQPENSLSPGRRS